MIEAEEVKLALSRLPKELLDARDYGAWLARLSDDLTYFMPMKRNVKSGEHAARERTREGRDINWFEEDKWTLTKRAEHIPG